MKKSVIAVLLAVLLFGSILPFRQAEAATRFKDVSNSHANKTEIDYLVNRNIIRGYPDGTFKPSQTVTNAQAAVMVARALKLNVSNRPNPNYRDVTPKTSGYYEIAALADEGILPKANQFKPDSAITRASMARILTRAFKLSGRNHVNFTDVPTSHWAYTYIDTLAANDVTSGYPDGTFKPETKVTRAHFSAFLARALEPSYRPAKTVTRGMRFGMTMAQVERIESAPLIAKDRSGNTSILLYGTTKYGYNADLIYLFENGKLEFIAYDFMGDDQYYHSWNELDYLHTLLHNNMINEFGEDGEYMIDGSSFMSLWSKGFYDVVLHIHDENLYTEALLVYMNPNTAFSKTDSALPENFSKLLEAPRKNVSIKEGRPLVGSK